VVCLSGKSGGGAGYVRADRGAAYQEKMGLGSYLPTRLGAKLGDDFAKASR
jgi:hypothetical protein